MLIQFRERKQQINNPVAGADILQSILRSESLLDRDKEHFWTIGLNTRNVVKYVDLVSLGTLNASLIHPREVFRLAIMEGAANIILGHNHPCRGRYTDNEKVSRGRQDTWH